MGTTTSTLEPSRYARLASLGRCIREHAYESFGASPRERGCHQLRFVPMTALTPNCMQMPSRAYLCMEKDANEAMSSLAFARHSEDVGYRSVTGHFLGRGNRRTPCPAERRRSSLIDRPLIVRL